MSTCILVLGTPRSGTSCVAGILHHLGVPMGERLLEPDTWNPAGYYQDADFEQWLALFDPFWGSADYESPLPRERALSEIQALIEARNVQPLWGLKSNRIVHFLEELNVATDLKVIRMSRPKAASAASWRARSGHTLTESSRIVNYIDGLIDSELSRIGVTTLVMDFRNIIAEPREAITQIAAFAGVDENEAAFNWVQPNLVRFD